MGTVTEASWTQRADIDLSAYANRTVILKFIVTATDTGSNLSRAKAWVDSISVGPPSASTDTTPPTVNITAPANAATVSGTVDVTASASDAVGVKKVEFYIDGSLADTSTAAPYVFTWNTAGVANGSHSLMAKAYDGANNVSTDNDTLVTVSNTSGGTTTVSFTSIAADDGYVKANADGTSPAVGTISTPAIGKGTDAKINRAFFSFDTSSLPDTATLVRASLKVTLSSAGGDPWADPAAGNTLVIDLKNGTFGTAATETTDYAAAPTAAAVAEIIKFTTGTQSSADFNASGLASLNKTGKTQARLQFKQNPSGTSYLFLTEGTGATLTVEYK
ncbi:Ig-like domain-containing protein [Archangium gephyra]